MIKHVAKSFIAASFTHLFWRLQVTPLRSLRLCSWLGASAILFSAIVSLPQSAWAQPSQPENAQAQLISEVKTIQAGSPFWVALQLKLRPEWHVYWKNPGDSGAAPSIQWTLPPGFQAGELVFPYPTRIPVEPLMNFGYEDEVYLLTEITPTAQVASKSITLRAQAEVLVCKLECIPEQKTLTLTVPVAPTASTKDPAWTDAFTRTRQAHPQTSPWESSFAVDDKDLTLFVNAPGLAAGQLKQVEFFPDKDGVIQNAAPQRLTVAQDRITLQIERGYQEKQDLVEGLLVVQEGSDGKTNVQAFTIQAKPQSINAANAANAETPSKSRTEVANFPIWQALLLALAGGVVLNLMPCVFPVLSLKVLTIAQQAQQNPRQARFSGLAFTTGVLASFGLIAGALLILRSLGQEIGWGFQLQAPVFVLLMAYVLFAVGLSLSGVFTVGASIMGLGHSLTAKPGYSGEFFTGVLATVMATPCTAPFMATAVSVALVQPTPVAIAILLTLGLGLALPYLVISLTPALRRFLPKPGAWMETLQQILAFPMYGAVAWLVWVLTLQVGTNGLAIALVGIILIGFAAWLHQKTQVARSVWRRVGLVGSLAAIAIVLTLTPLVNSSVPSSSSTQSVDPSSANSSVWAAYTPSQLDQLRQSKQPVFINYTAAWCITCLVNERIALSQPEVLAAFQQKGVALVKADWTNRNAEITQSLSKFGRSGVPLYVLYPNGLEQSEPVILPQVLTPDLVRDAVASVSVSL
ncbi:thioredoxin family protein [Phormidium sp. CLA17]|uniref:protein-disulfide reductase DsbD family protein n=1 Tax=Leptolyngbya sp. Cla-17 TaxID=2803751 RepID=UPI001493242E|nr:thioredoxin family protein [Leptolyngbya sp. Cla-17]MBM0742047.1 thioredoxin family protein [Leptolyngbya sp. Cla-17]